ncbi:MAG: hypothetical protein ACRDVM_10645 [Acidimicrobiia bacterium]
MRRVIAAAIVLVLVASLVDSEEVSAAETPPGPDEQPLEDVLPPPAAVILPGPVPEPEKPLPVTNPESGKPGWAVAAAEATVDPMGGPVEFAGLPVDLDVPAAAFSAPVTAVAGRSRLG